MGDFFIITAARRGFPAGNGWFSRTWTTNASLPRVKNPYQGNKLRCESVKDGIGSESLRGAPASASQDVVDGDGASAEENQGKCQRGCGQWKLVAGVVGRAEETIVQMHLPDRDDEIDADREGRWTRKESRQ